MGDFDMSCALSGLTINEGDKIGFILLKFHYPEPHRSQLLTEHRACTVNSNDHYVPYLPVVFGKYKGYGRFGGVKNSVTTEIIEELFHKPANKVINAVASPQHSRSIYYEESPIFKLYQPEQVNDTKLGYHSPVEEGLTAYGFVKETTKDDCYSFENFTVFKEGDEWFATNFSPHGTNRTVRLNLTHHSREYDDVLHAFGKATGVYPGFKPAEYEAIRNLNSMSGMVVLKEVYTSMMNRIKEWDDFGFRDAGFHSNWEDFNRIIAEHQASLVGVEKDSFEASPLKLHTKLIGNRFGDDRGEFLKLDLEHVHLLTKYYGTDDIFKAYKLPSLFQAVNRIIEPSLSGEEMGNREASKALHEITGTILRERDEKREREDY